MSNKKRCYQMPATKFVRLEMKAQILAESPTGPASAPVNAQRNGYGDAQSEVW